MEYKYYISYIANKTFAGEILQTNIPLDTESGLAGAIKYLQKENKTDTIIVLFIKKLKG